MRIQTLDDNGGLVDVQPTAPSKATIEKVWAKSEIERTDQLEKLSDYPHKIALEAYRVKLRAYNFSGDRPEIPTTPNGTPL